MFKSAITPKGEETRQRLHQTAMRLFREKGLDATTMRDVAAAAGMSLGAAYHYFPSKEAIVVAYYEGIQDEHARQVLAAHARGDDPGVQLAESVLGKLRIVEGDQRVLGALLRFTGDPSHPLSFLGEATRPLQKRSIAAFLVPLEAMGVAPDLRPLAALLLWALHMGLLLYFLYDATPGHARTHRLALGATQLFANALRLLRLPLLKPFRTRVTRLLNEAGLLPTAAELDRLRQALVSDQSPAWP